MAPTLVRPGQARFALLAVVLALIGCPGSPTAPETPSTGKATTKPTASKATPASSPSTTAAGAPSASPTGAGSTGSTTNASPTPAGSPSATPSASGSSTPAPNATPTPSATPTASATPTPAGSGTPAPTAAPTAGPTPAPGAVAVGDYAGDGTAGLKDGAVAAAQFRAPRGLALGPDGAIYVADTGNHAIRKIKNGVVSTVMGDGTETTPNDPVRLSAPRGLVVDNAGVIYVADTKNHRIRKLAVGATQLDFMVGNGGPGSADGRTDAAQVNFPADVALDGAGKLWVSDSANHTIRRVTIATNDIALVAGKAGDPGTGSVNGTGADARFNQPQGVAIDAAGNLYVADFGNGEIRMVTPAGVVTTVVADGSLFSPSGVVVAPDGSSLTLADGGSHVIKRWTKAGGVLEDLVAAHTPGYMNGNGTTAQFGAELGDMVIDATGAILVADTSNNRIRKISVAP